MGLQHIFTAAQNQMVATLAALVPPVTAPLFRVGADKLTFEDAPPRIVWVPGREVMLGPHAQGGDGIRNPRPLQTRHCSVQVHVWAADLTGAEDHVGAVEALLRHLVAAIHDVAHGAWEAKGGDWGVGQASTTRMGAVYVLDIELLVPLTREDDIFATVTTMPITPQVQPPA